MKKETLFILYLLLITVTILTSCSQVVVNEKSADEEQVKKSNSQGTAIESRGSIGGLVTLAEESNDLSGVSITIEGLSSGAYTAVDGSFKIAQVPPGKYKLIYSKFGYKSVRVESVIVEGGKKTSLAAQHLLLNELTIINSTIKSGDQHATILGSFFTFSEPLYNGSIDINNFSIQGGTESVKIEKVHSYLNTFSIEFTNKLEYSTNYILSFSGLKGQYGGQQNEPQIINFRTHSGPPEIVSITPAAESRDFPIDDVISFTFNKEMEPSTINSENIQLKGRRDSFVVETTITYEPLTRTVTVKPKQALDYGIIYGLKIQYYKLMDINGVRGSEHRDPKKNSDLNDKHFFETVPLDLSNAMGQWTEVKTFSGWEPICFSFDGTANKSYEISWDDLNGSGKYTVACYMVWNEGKRHKLDYSGGHSYGSGYPTGPKVKVTETGKVYFYMQNNSGTTGTIAIKVTELP